MDRRGAKRLATLCDSPVACHRKAAHREAHTAIAPPKQAICQRRSRTSGGMSQSGRKASLASTNLRTFKRRLRLVSRGWRQWVGNLRAAPSLQLTQVGHEPPFERASILPFRRLQRSQNGHSGEHQIDRYQPTGSSTLGVPRRPLTRAGNFRIGSRTRKPVQMNWELKWETATHRYLPRLSSRSFPYLVPRALQTGIA